jgi:RES domain-containing protein
LDAVALAGVWYRQVPAAADPLYRPPHPGDARWQRGSVVEALYFADTAATAWAEWYRALAEAALPPAESLPRDLWRWRIALPRVADLSDDERLAGEGLPPPVPTRRQWPACQAVGERLHAAGWAAIVAASAARPEGRTLCVFRRGRAVAGAAPDPPPVTVAQPPGVPTGLRT